MRIRSVTAFVEINYPIDSGIIAQAGAILAAARKALEDGGLVVQTTRLATQPLPLILAEAGPEAAVELAKDLEAISFVHDIDYIALGGPRLADPPPFAEVLADVLAHTERTFVSAEIATTSGALSLPRIRRVSRLIKRVSRLTEDGFTNLRLAALANVQPWSPFFPAAYHGGGPIALAVATESADLAVSAIGGVTSLRNAQANLVTAIEAAARQVEEVLMPVCKSLGADLKGIDFSLAPYPDEMRSIGGALEKIGLARFGGPGSVFTAAFLTGCIDQADFARTGFCGLMLPVLEDSTLARRAADATLGVENLLTFSAVCGTGLDTIPLPGDVGEDTLAGVLLDVAALALRLQKPLTARLMPLPGQHAGDSIAFDFEYFAPSRVLAITDQEIGRLLGGDETFSIAPFTPVKSKSRD